MNVTAGTGLLANDSDPDGHAITVTEINGNAVTNGQTVTLANGSLTINTDGSFDFTPDAGFTGQQNFIYTIDDAIDGADAASVTIDVTPPATALPDAVDDSYSVDQDTTLNVTAGTGLLANDTDPDGHSFTVTAIDGNAVTNGQTVTLANGSLTINEDGSFDFTPNAGFFGQQTFTYTIDDTIDGTDTATVTIDVNQTGILTVTNGLVLNLQSDAVTLGGGTSVVGWDDASNSGNDLLASGDPQLLAGATPTGADAIRLDGVDDKLERLGTDLLFDLPNGSEDRTVFFVADYIDANNVSSGIAFGDGEQNEAFGLVTNRNDELMVQGWGTSNDSNSGISAGDNLGNDEWLVQSVVVDQDILTHYLNGNIIDIQAQTFATDSDSAASSIVIGEEIANLGFSELDVAAVLVYDRALNETEREEVETFLQQKYIDSDFIL